jgi:organic radical activating enzyme
MVTLAEKQIERVKGAIYEEIPPFPRELFLELNNTCNHTCFFCSNEKMTRSTKQMPFSLVENIMGDAYLAGARDIAFYATGEPFMYKRLPDAIKKAREIGYEYIFITSNGALADSKKSIPVINAGLDSIKFSINAGTKESYEKTHGQNDFDKVIKNVRWWHQYRVDNKLELKIYVSMVPTPANQGEYDHLMSLIGDCLDQEIDQRQCSNQGGNMLENNTIVEIDEKSILGTLKFDQYTDICPDPFNRVVVSSEGYLTACVVDYQNALIIADLNSENIKDAWVGKKYRNFRKRHLEKNLAGLICHNCMNNCHDPYKPLDVEYFKPFLKIKDMSHIPKTDTSHVNLRNKRWH